MNIYIYLHLYLLRKIYTSKDIVFLYILTMYTKISVHTHTHTRIYACIAMSIGIYLHILIHIHMRIDIRRNAARCFRAHGFVGVTASGAARADERLRPTCA